MGWLRDAFDVAHVVYAALAGPIRAVRRIPIVDDIAGSLSNRYFNPVVVRQITDPGSPDLLRSICTRTEYLNHSDLRRLTLQGGWSKTERAGDAPTALVTAFSRQVQTSGLRIQSIPLLPRAALSVLRISRGRSEAWDAVGNLRQAI